MKIEELAEQIRQLPAELLQGFDGSPYLIWSDDFLNGAGGGGNGTKISGLAHLVGTKLVAAFTAGAFSLPVFESLRKRLKSLCRSKGNKQLVVAELFDWLYIEHDQDLYGPHANPIHLVAEALLAVAHAKMAKDDRAGMIPHRTAFPMLGIEGKDSKQASKIMASIRTKAGRSLGCGNPGNQWWYEAESWNRVVKLVRAAGGWTKYVEPTPDELSERKAAEREKSRLR